MEQKNNIFKIILAVISVIGAGVAGYMWVEGWTFEDSLYMTLITLTTTGYQEVNPLSSDGRIFTMILLLTGMGILAYSVSYLIQELMSIDFAERWRGKMLKKIKKLKGHVILCGFGRMGHVVCKELHDNGTDFVVIETNQKHIKELESLGYLWIEGDATSDETLLRANIKEARTVACMVDGDSDSLYISLAAKHLNPDVFILARGNEEAARAKIMRAGADKVVLPIVISGLKIAQTLMNPAIDDVLEIEGVSSRDDQRVQMTEVNITSRSKLKGKTLLNCGMKTRGFMVVGVRHDTGKFTFAPSPGYEFKVGDTLITLTTPEAQEELKQIQKAS